MLRDDGSIYAPGHGDLPVRFGAPGSTLVLVPPPSGSPILDLVTPYGNSGPANASYLSGGASPIDVNPLLGPFLPAGQQLAQSVTYTTTHAAAPVGEYGHLLNFHDVTGYDPSNAGVGVNLGLFTYAEAQSGKVWGIANDLQLSSGTHRINAFTDEIDLNNYRGDYGAPGAEGSAVGLQMFFGGPNRSSAAIAIGDMGVPTDPAHLVDGIQICCGKIASNSTIHDLSNSANGYLNQGTHAGSAFTDGGTDGTSSSPGFGFNFYGKILGSGAAFRVAGTPGNNAVLVTGSGTVSTIADLSQAPTSYEIGGAHAVGLRFDPGATFSGYQVQGQGWNVNPGGAITAAYYAVQAAGAPSAALGVTCPNGVTTSATFAGGLITSCGK